MVLVFDCPPDNQDSEGSLKVLLGDVGFTLSAEPPAGSLEQGFAGCETHPKGFLFTVLLSFRSVWTDELGTIFLALGRIEGLPWGFHNKSVTQSSHPATPERVMEHF